MDRLFTAFVSSTFLDLRAERQRLVKVLLDLHCVPLGMEFFPSTGRGQWESIQEAISAADFGVFVLAGRYGSISDETGTSWTQREFRECVTSGMPMIGILHEDVTALPDAKREPTLQGRRRLDAFRREVEAHTVVRYFTTEADLVQAVGASVTALRRQGAIEGWVRAGRNPVVLQESDFDRIYQYVETGWHFMRSEASDTTWDAIYFARRHIVANQPEGLDSVALDFTRESDQELPFSDGRHPQLELVAATRDGPGSVSLRPPRKRTGSSFVQDVAFDPPLAQGESVDFSVRGTVPSIRYAYRDDLLAATVDSRNGPRPFDWAWRYVVFPTRRLVLRVFLPLDLGATPKGPLVSRGDSRVDPELSNAVSREGSYSSAVCERDGTTGHELALDLRNPALRRRYRLSWNLPVRRNNP